MATHQAQLTNAVNMDTGYVSLLTETEKRDVLSWTRAALGKAVKFVTGAYIENQEGDVVSLLPSATRKHCKFRCGAHTFSDRKTARQIGRRKSGDI